MKLPSFLPNKQKSSFYLALLLADEKASAVILEEVSGKIKIISEHTEYFSILLEKLETDELITTLDKTISRAEEMLPADVETEKTIFGVKEDWIDDKKIKKDYLAKLKKVCDELRLSPIGFLVTTEAIIHLIQKEEGSPVSAILADIGKQTTTLSLFRGSKLVETKTIPTQKPITTTVDTLLKEFTSVEVLPSRLIILNEEKNEEIVQEFISHTWSKGIPFLHVPQISVLPEKFDTKSIVFGAATQMGFETLGQAAINKNDIETLGTSRQRRAHEETSASEKDAPSNSEANTDTEEEDKPKDEDTPSDMVTAENFGFVENEDVGLTPKVTPHPRVSPETEETFQEASEHREEKRVHDAPEENEETEKKSFSLPGIVMMSTFFSSLKVPRIPFPSLRGTNKILLLLPVMLLLIIGAIGFYLFTLRATVTITLQPKNVQQSEKVTFSTTGGNDFSSNTLSAKEISTSLSGSASTSTTGQKDTGNKAKGTVTIYNSGESKKQLSSGAVVTSSNNLAFTLDKDVSISSASGDIFSGTKSGTAQVSVTAKAIGTDSNLPSNTKFTVEGNSDLAAKNDAAFSGGTKKTLQVVAKKDIDTLLADIPKTLEKKAKEDLTKKLASDETLLPDLSHAIDKKDFDKEIGEEAKSVTVNATVTFTSASYANKDTIQFAQSLLKNKFTKDQTIPEESIHTEVSNLKTDDTESSGTLKITAGLLPKLDTDQIQKGLTAKSFSEAKIDISRLPQVKTVEITLSPSLPFVPQILPRITKNIQVVIKSQ